MKTIPLTKGKVALVDDADFESLNRFRWCVSRSRCGKRWYAVRRGTVAEGGRLIRMHRQILNAPAGADVDHRDGDGLNCQRGNLRIATRQQNGRNQRHHRNKKTSTFKGVSKHWNGSWRATIKVGATGAVKRVHLGLFQDQRDAARAYDRAAIKFFGEFAALNFGKEANE